MFNPKIHFCLFKIKKVEKIRNLSKSPIGASLLQTNESIAEALFAPRWYKWLQNSCESTIVHFYHSARTSQKKIKAQLND